MGSSKERDVPARQRFDMADAVPLLLDARMAVTSWTADAERLLGYPAGEVLGRRAADLLIPEDAARIPDLADRCHGDGGWAGLLSARHRDGHPLKLMVRVVPLRAAGGPVRWVVLLAELADSPGWHMSRSVLERITSRSPVGIAIVDPDLRYVWSNAALEQFGGGPPEQRLGRRLADIQPGLDAERIEAQMLRVLETGDPVVAYEHVGRVRSAPHRETSHAMSFIRLEDDHGDPIGVYYTVVDIGESYRARRRLALLDRAGEHIGRSLDVMQTAQELADVAVPGLADFVAVDLLESVLKGASRRPVHGATRTRCRCVAPGTSRCGAGSPKPPSGSATWRPTWPGLPRSDPLPTASPGARSGWTRWPRSGPRAAPGVGAPPSSISGCTA